MSRSPKLVASLRSLPLVVGILGVLTGGGLLVLRLSPIWVGLSILAVSITSLSVAHWWERRGALTAWIPFLLGAAVLLGGLVLWRDLREDEALSLMRRLDREEEAARLEVAGVFESTIDTVEALAGDGVPRGLRDVTRQIDAAMDADPSLVAVELVTPDLRIETVRRRPQTLGPSPRPDEEAREELAEAVERALATGEPQVAGPFEGSDGRLLLRILIPLQADATGELVLAGVFSVDQMFSGLRASMSPLFDLQVEADDTDLYRTGGGVEGAPVRSRPLLVGGRGEWSVDVEISPTEELLDEEQTGLAEIALGVAVGLALLLALSTWFGERAARRARAFEAAVSERTWELEAARAEAQAANQAKDRFLAMLGHELRNPLASINTALEVLRSHGEVDAERSVRMQEIVHRQMDHLARLVDDLLDVSRIERGKLPLEREALDLAQLVRDVADAERARIEEAGVELEVDTDRRPLWVDGDPTRLTQVAFNLLSNAAKFTEPGGTIGVTAHRVGGGDETAIVTVHDTGAGIDAEDLERVFEPFAQTELGEQRSTGLGLGLPIVKGLIEAHDGTIRAHSEGRGHGTTIEIRIPLREAPETETAGRPHDATETADDREEGRRILVIDDHADSREALRDLLQVFGHRVEVAKDGAEGLASAAAGSADGLEVVICDIGLPGDLDGYGVAERLRGTPETEGLRLVALTGWGDESSIRRALDAGFDHHLTKPVDPKLLRRILAE